MSHPQGGVSKDEARQVDTPDSDLFDVLAHVLFTLAPKPRHDRAEPVRQCRRPRHNPDRRPEVADRELLYLR